MRYHQLKLDRQRGRRRIGRGIAAGGGKTAGRGTKGQGARAGARKRPGFEGGQNPLYMRLPKLRGFRRPGKAAATVTTGQVISLAVNNIDRATLLAAGLIKRNAGHVRLVLKGDIDRPLSVRLDGITGGASRALTASGGRFEPVASSPGRTKITTDRSKRRTRTAT